MFVKCGNGQTRRSLVEGKTLDELKVLLPHKSEMALIQMMKRLEAEKPVDEKKPKKGKKEVDSEN
jgi:hypothetical protein